MNKRKRTNSSTSTTSSETKDDASIIAQVHQLWNRLEKHLKEKRPGIFESLNPPASDEELKEFETNLRFPLPIEFRTLYKIHNGQANEKASSVEECFYNPIDIAAIWMPLSECETQNSPKQLDFLTFNMKSLKEEKNKKGKTEKPPSPPPPPPTGSGRGKGGKGLLVQTEDNPLNGFIGFISNHMNNDSVECCGILLGLDKATQLTRVYRWHGQMKDVLELEEKGTFLKWFEDTINEMENPKEDNDDDDKETKKEEEEKKSKLPMTTSKRLKNMNCIITGLFDPHKPQDIADYIIRNGGKISQNITGTVTHMILGKPGVIPPYNIKTGKGSKKYREAKKKKRIQTIEFEELQDIINGNKDL